MSVGYIQGVVKAGTNKNSRRALTLKVQGVE